MASLLTLFTIAGSALYIGHASADCEVRPSPWRFGFRWRVNRVVHEASVTPHAIQARPRVQTTSPHGDIGISMLLSSSTILVYSAVFRSREPPPPMCCSIRTSPPHDGGQFPKANISLPSARCRPRCPGPDHGGGAVRIRHIPIHRGGGWSSPICRTRSQSRWPRPF